MTDPRRGNPLADCGSAGWLVVGIVVFYYAIVMLLAYNFPISDDFFFLDFVTNVVTSPDLHKSLQLLYAQHNEHRPVTTKLLYLVEYWLLGKIDFRYLILAGNLFQLATFCVVVKHAAREVEQRCYFAIFAACMIFQFGSAENMLWAMAATTNYAVLMFAVLTLSLLTNGGRGYYLPAISCAVLGVFTQGSGLLIPFIASAYLIAQRRGREGLVMALAAIGSAVAYFFEYQSPAHANPLDALHDPFGILVFAISLTGSAFGAGGSHYPLLTAASLIPTLGLGAAIWALTGYGFYKKWHADGNIFIWLNVFVILTATVIALSRSHFGLAQSMVPRYHHYSAIAIVASVPLALRLLAARQLSSAVIDRLLKRTAALSVVYLAATLVFVGYFYLVVFAPIRSGEMIFSDPELGLRILEKANSSGIFPGR